MDEKKKIRTTEWITAFILIAASFALGDHVGKSSVEAGAPEIIRDTTVKIVTRYRDFPDPVKTAKAGFVRIPAYRFISDTVTQERILIVHDTTAIYITREQKYYEEADGALRLWISGVDPRLDRYEWDQTTTTITETIRPKPKRWGLSIYAGGGITIAGGKILLGPQAGAAITYDILQW